jgi:hypothetical protein
MIRSAIVLGVLAIASRASAGGVFLPPLEVEVGAASISTRDGSSVIATQWMVGASWASGNPRSTPIDASVGVISTSSTESRPGEVTDATGGFLDLALRIREGRNYRLWAGVRGELMGTEGVGVLGATGRVSAELWRGASSAGRDGGVLGVFALSVWVELGVRERPDRDLARTGAVGLGLRLPMIFLR